MLHAVDILAKIGDQLRHFLRRGVAHRVRHVQSGSAGGHGVGVALGQKCPVGAGRVLGGKLNIIAEALGVGHHFADTLEHLLPRHPQLVLHVDIAGGEKHMDTGVVGLLHGVPRGVDVAFGAAGQRGHGAVRHGGGNGLHALVIHGRGDGKARLNDVHAQLFQLFGHLDLFRQIHAASGGLLAVPQGRVKNFDSFHLSVPPACFSP